MTDANTKNPEAREGASGKEARIRLGAFGRKRYEITNCTAPEAAKRETAMRTLARDMVDAGLAAEADAILKRAGRAENAEAFRVAINLGNGLCSGKIPKKTTTGLSTTFQMLGEDWTSGRLNKRFPDQVRLKRTRDEDAATLGRHVYPVIGPKAVADVTLDDAEDVMRRLPEGLSPLTRRNVGHLVARLLKLAVYPLRLIPASPIPPGFLPQRGERKALACLYPDEDRRLLECRNVPLCFRLLWGFLTREGMREGEALGLTWGALDLKRGAVRLEKNKTDDPRAWALDPGVARALEAYKRTDAKPEDLVFVDPHGRTHSKFGLALLLRSHLEAAGLKKERPELFESTAERKQIRVHDLRGTFVTVSLANDRTESWISDRTGHRSSAMINRYKRISRTFTELGLGRLAPLDEAIPELRGDGGPKSPDEGWATERAKKPRTSKKTRRPQRDSSGRAPESAHGGEGSSRDPASVEIDLIA